uniref:Uncharacterized protein LOC111104909 n=1 Tax=Crassostrea virginica TaxID=6565 RepID=A0A8B8AVS2_CRAVI|nr:uncharacterized protein LOC111104909 [Crassostrea virginica]
MPTKTTGLGLFVIAKAVVLYSAVLSIIAFVVWFIRPRVFEDIKATIRSYLLALPWPRLGHIVIVITLPCSSLLGLVIITNIVLVGLVVLSILSVIVRYFKPNLFSEIAAMILSYISGLISKPIKQILLGFILGSATTRLFFIIGKTVFIYPVVLIDIFLIRDFMTNKNLFIGGLVGGIFIGIIS